MKPFYLNELLGKSLSQFSSSNQGMQCSIINPMMSAPMESNYISPSELEQILSKILGTKTSEELNEIKKYILIIMGEI